MNSIHCVQLVSDMLVFQFSNQQNFFSSLSQYVPQQLPGYGAVQIKSSARHILPISCFVCVRYPLSYCSCYTSYQFSFDDVLFINNNKNHFLLTNRLGVLHSFTHVLKGALDAKTYFLSCRGTPPFADNARNRISALIEVI